MRIKLLMDAVNSDISTSQPTTRRRLLFLDGLRGLAAMAVVGYHFYGGNPAHESLAQLLPSWLGSILQRGYLGVEVFFVISGFVVAYSVRSVVITPAYAFEFMVRRLCRLAFPYWTAIVLMVISIVVSNWVLRDRAVALPSVESLLAHGLYLQGLLGMDQILPIFWTLCLEVQFYLVFIVLAYWGIDQDDHKLILATMFGVFSLIVSCFTGVKSESSGLFLPYWYMFFCGVLLERSVGRAWLLFFFLGVVALVTGVMQDVHGLMVVVTGGVIYGAIVFDKMERWLGQGWVQYLGRISYSLYLVHLIVGTRILNLGYREQGTGGMTLIWFGLAIAASLVAAHVMFVWVEQPSMALSRRVVRILRERVR
jgi:peptidoglycan/LPS O-acetylase OafA/YrhL